MERGTLTESEFVRMVDHTALRPDATERDILKLCGQAQEYAFRAVCIAPYWVSLAAKRLEGCSTVVAAVIGFPHGNTLALVKAFEAAQSVGQGARELDMVINIGALRSGDRETVLSDILGVVATAKDKAGDSIVKVILETCLLTTAEIEIACTLAVKTGADFVKTSTGFGSEGATEENVALMKRMVGGALKVKAAGGIRNYETAERMWKAGADRLGCSSSVEIVREIRAL